jgi:UDP:flavonoid glycosyltransferase YjiC (YdhE family)
VIAAERLDLPYATVLCIASGSFVRTEVVGEPLNEVRAEHGLPPDPELEMLSRYLVLSPFPPSYRDPAFPLPATAHSLRPLAAAPTADDAAPAWLADLAGAPTVYFALGTIFNMESGISSHEYLRACVNYRSTSSARSDATSIPRSSGRNQPTSKSSDTSPRPRSCLCPLWSSHMAGRAA